MLAKFRPLMATAAKARAPPAVTASTAAAAAVEREEHVHYKHTDACHQLRWTAKESYEYMYARPWSRVVDFYASLCAPAPAPRGSPSYLGKMRLVEKHLGQFVDERKAKQLEARSLPIEGCAVVAGCTDKGVTALQQVCSFYTWRKDVKSGDIKDAINEAAPDKLKPLHVSEVAREFHPNFAAKWRSGPPTECFMFHSRAAVAKLHSANEDYKEGMMVMCVELVANRFLRKMVRVLVATAIREAAAGAGDDDLLKLMEATDRRATAPLAPPEGLCLVDVGYEDFSKQRCFIVD
ncbi:unnamed protein product [Miscanthus lutarioriparius]|uniref:tRNA pseudouridine synthase n=1 Tax=Miscanthus lutarioriparius TaxID=422564 RepID=A0A811S0V6_9POAL|nr:unnamed protein product [Miscanthus lutarioriparius]